MTMTIDQVITDLEGFMESVDDANSLPREAGRFVHALVLATQAKRCLEIGTSYGYSGLWTLSALRHTDGRLTTIDRDPKKIAAARSRFIEAGVDHRVTLLEGEALRVLEEIRGEFDFVLLDVDKENCIRYFELISPHLAPGAVVLTDNVDTHARELAGFLDWVRSRDGVFSTAVPVGNGMELSIKR